MVGESPAREEKKVLYTEIDIRKYFEEIWLPLGIFFDACPLYAPKFCKWPASTNFHHNWAGGLWQHTYETIVIAQTSPLCGLNEIVACFWHDMGKLIEYNVAGTKVETANSHVNHSAMLYLANKDIYKVPSLDPDIIVNEIYAHHKKPEWGALKIATTEGELLVHNADSCSSKIGAIRR